MMNRALALILIFVSSWGLCCRSLRSARTAASAQSPSLDEQRPVRRASCPVTHPPAVPFTPPGEPKEACGDDWFWLGTEKLYLFLPKSGEAWGWLPRTPDHMPRMTAKIFWGSVDFDYHKDEDYSLKVTGRRLDGDAPPLEADRVTNALFEPRAAMLTAVYVPTPGCWEITGDYKGDKLSYVVWVYPEKPSNR
jgi:hypothetical protein